MGNIIIPGATPDFNKMAKEAGAPPPAMQPQTVDIGQVIVQIMAQVFPQMFAKMMEPYEERIKALEDKITDLEENDTTKAMEDFFNPFADMKDDTNVQN